MMSALRHCLVVLLCLSSWNRADARDLYELPAPQLEREHLVIDAVGDYSAVEPLLRDFQSQNPHTSISYYDGLTNELFQRLDTACASNNDMADLVFSSSIDHMLKLVNDGCASKYQSAGTLALPAHARWQNEVFGFTFEPAVLVFNSKLVPQGITMPRNRDEFVSLLREHEEELSGKVGTYDIASSGIGYLFAHHDGQISPVSQRLLEGLARTKARLYCCSGTLLTDIETGKLLIGYNVLGSYAYGRLKAGAPIGIIMMRDYTLFLSRAAFLPKRARNPQAGRRFLDYLVSPRGQRIVADRSFHFAFTRTAPPGVDAPDEATLPASIRPIAINSQLLAVTDQQNQRKRLTDWKRTFSQQEGR